MQGNRTSEGLEFVLRPRGLARYPGALFLSVWLCGWLAGETFAIWMLVKGAIALLTGTPPGAGREPLVLATALAVGAFLLVWLFFWTIGGYAAARHLLQLLWSSDRIVAGIETLQIFRRLGPFRSRTEISRSSLRRIYITEGDRAITADTDTGPVALTSLGAPAERDEVASELRQELRVPEEREAEGTAASLPDGWEEIATPEGDRALVRSLAVRSRQARVAGYAAAFLAAICFILVRRAMDDPKQIGAAIMFGVAAAGCGWGADRLWRGRIEWRITIGSITRRRRYGSRLIDQFEATRLELTRHSDSDGDNWYKLLAVASDAPEHVSSMDRSTGRKEVVSVLRDSAVPRRLGRWLAERARLPLEDKTTKEAQALDTARALSQLKESGPLGRRVAGWIERLEARRGSRT